MSAKYKSPSFLLPNEINTDTNPLNTDSNPATGTGVNSLYSMDFDGTQNIDCGNDSSLTPTNSISISLWVKTNDGGNYRGLIDKWSSSTGYMIHLGASGVNQGKPVFGIGASDISSSVAVNDGSWHHIAVTCDNTTGYIYVDGVQTGTGSLTMSGISNSDNLKIAGDNTSTFYLDGQIDEVAIFNRALNTTEIAALYEGTGSNIYPSNLMATNLNPLAYYPLGEQAQMQGYLGNEASSEWQFPNGVLQDYVIDFNSAEAINTSSISDFEFIHNSKVFTISAWFNLDSLSTPVKKTIIQNTYTASAGSGFNLWIDNRSSAKKIRFNLDDQANPTVIDYTYSSMATGKWVNVIVTGGGPGANNCKMFINGGTEVASATLGSATSVNSSYSPIIGSRVDSDSASFFNGQLSNIAIWNTDQSANIANIYNNGSPQTTYTVTPQNWWKLNAKDSVYTPSAPNYTTALDFGGTSDYIDLGRPASLNLMPGTDEFTVSAWFNCNDDGTIYSFGAPTSSSTTQFKIVIRGNTAPAYYPEVTLKGQSTNIGSTAYNDSKWHHIVVSVNTSNANVYIDGQNVGTATIGTATISNTENGAIGARTPSASGGGFNFDGSISNVAVYNSALSSSQVSTLFNFGTPETSISFSPIGWWKLDNTTTGIQDSSGNGNNGTNNGASQVSSSVAVVPSWKITNALPIATPNYTTALDFDGADDYIDCGTSQLVDFNSSFTISAWVYITSTASGYDAVYAFKGASHAFVMFFNNGPGYSPISFGSANYLGGDGTIRCATNVTINQWNNIVVVYNGNGIATPSNYTFYINNEPQTLTTSSGFTHVVNANYIGRYDPTHDFDGSISNVAVFNSALSPSQVSTLFNNGTPEASISFSPTSWWKLDNLTTGLLDSGSASNNGTVTGASTPTEITSDVITPQPVNGVSTTLPSTALQQSNLQFEAPYSNYSLKFDVVSYVDTNFAIPNWTQYAYSIWFKFNGSTISGYDHLIGNLSSGANADGRAIIGFTGTNLYLNMGDGTNYWFDESQSAAPLLDGNWHHIVLNVYETGQDIYVDGSLLRTYTYTGSVTTGTPATSNNYINKGGSASSSNGVDSSVDEHSVFNRLLTTAEILSIYNNGRPSDISALSPSYWWRLGENAYFNDVPAFTLPNSISGAPNGTGSGSVTTMLSADAPGTYANGVGTNLDIVNRVGDAPLSTSNSQSYNMIPDDKVPYVPAYVGDQIANNFSMTFDGANDYIDCNTSLNGMSSITYSVWIKPQAPSGNYGYILAAGNYSSTDRMLSIAISSGLNSSGPSARKLFVYGGGGSGGSYWWHESNFSVTYGTWYHVAIVYTNNQDVDFYVNGNAEGSIQFSNTTSIAAGSPTRIGVYSGSLQNYFNGEIDEVAIFDKALTADQIKFDLYSATTPGKTADIANNTNLPTPVAWYRMGD